MGLSTADEVRVVALLAQGAKYREIIEDFRSRGKTMTYGTVSKVKKRNRANLDVIGQKMLMKELADARSLHVKSHQLLKRKLDRALNPEDELEDLKQRWQDGDMTEQEYTHLSRQIIDSEPSISELVSISKEMHSQSTKEPEPPAVNAAEDLHKLVQAIQSGDTVTLERLVFNADEQSSQGPSERPLQVSQFGPEREGEGRQHSEGVPPEPGTTAGTVPQTEVERTAETDGA